MVAALVGCALVPTPGNTQTLQQLSDMGSNIVPRLTRTVARNRVGADLFGDLGGKVSYVQGDASPPTAFEFATDRAWNRILYGRKDDYINAFRNDAYGGVSGPRGLDVARPCTAGPASG